MRIKEVCLKTLSEEFGTALSEVKMSDSVFVLGGER